MTKNHEAKTFVRPPGRWVAFLAMQEEVFHLRQMWPGNTAMKTYNFKNRLDHLKKIHRASFKLKMIYMIEHH